MSSTASIAKSSFLVSRIMSRVSRGSRARTSAGDAGRAKAARLPLAAGGKLGHDREARPPDAREDELGDAVARPDRDLTLRVAVPGRDQQRSLIIGVND